MKEQAALSKGNVELQKWILDKYSDTMKKVYNAEIEKIEEMGSALRSVGDFISGFDDDIGRAISDISTVVMSVKEMNTATTGFGEISSLASIAGAVDNWAKKLST